MQNSLWTPSDSSNCAGGQVQVAHDTGVTPTRLRVTYAGP